MPSNRFVKSKLNRFLDYVLRLILLNFLIVIPSFSFLIVYSLIDKEHNTDTVWFYLTLIPVLIWFMPSIVATTDVIRQYEDDLTNTIFKDFFKSFKKHFFKAFWSGIIIYILVLLFSNSFNFFNINQAQGTVYLLGLIITISFILIAIFLLVNLPLVMAYFSDLSFIQYFKLALIMAFKDFGTTFLMVILVIIIGTLSVVYMVAMLFGCISLTIYFMVKLSFKQYIKIYRKVEREREYD